MYAGSQPEGIFHVSNSPKDVVTRLIQPITGTGRNVTVDNWFSSIPLAQDLLMHNNTTIVATIRKNKREIPKEFKTTKGKSVYSTNVWFPQRQHNIVVIRTKKK